MTGFIQVTTAINSKDGAQKIAQTLVERHLAACVHMAGPITSTYWWQDKMETEEEWTYAIVSRFRLPGNLEGLSPDIKIVPPALLGVQRGCRGDGAASQAQIGAW